MGDVSTPHKNAVDLLQSASCTPEEVVMAQAWATIALVDKLHEVVEAVYKVHDTIDQKGW